MMLYRYPQVPGTFGPIPSEKDSHVEASIQHALPKRARICVD